MHNMDPDEGLNNLASLKYSIQQSEASIRQMKQTIEVVDARLRRSPQSDNRRESVFNEEKILG
jgi:hypothetical protein